MATTRSIPDIRNTPRLKGVLMIDTFRGVIRARAWPRARGQSKSPAVRATNAWFKAAAQEVKYAAPEMWQAAIELTKHTGWYPRDAITAAMSTGLFEFHHADGRIVRPWPREGETIDVQGARLQRTSNLTLTAGVTTPIPWQSALIDDLGMWTAGAPTRLTIPNNVLRVDLTVSAQFLTSATKTVSLFLSKNGGPSIGRVAQTDAINSGYQATSGPVNVVPGDYFEAHVFASIAATVTNSAATFLSIEVLKAQ